MSEQEIEAYLQREKVIQVATMGPNGRPHVIPLWFFAHPTSTGAAPVLATWTYAKSQKTLNLQRLPQATVLLESGERYSELRGISMECDVEILTEYPEVREIGVGLIDRYGADYEQERATMVAVFEAQARKRVGLLLRATKVVSWDHSKA
jgi:hypothetical protein